MITVFVQPNAKKTELIEQINETMLRMRIKAPAKQGKANKELCSFLAKFFHVPISNVEIIHGRTTKIKQITIKSSPCV
jgi:hypothetical protein